MAKKPTLTAHIGSTFEKSFALKGNTDRFISIPDTMEPWLQVRDDNNVVIDSRNAGGNIEPASCIIGKAHNADAIIVRIETGVLERVGVGSYEAGIVLIQPQTATDPQTNKRVLEFTLKIREGVPR